MSLIVLENPQFLLNSVDLSNHIDQIELAISFADVDTTAFGSASKTRLAGLIDSKLTIEFQQDTAIASVEQTVWALMGTLTNFVLNEYNTSIATAGTSTNPQYTGSVLINDWKPVGGKVGELQKVSISWPISGNVSKNGAALT